ncbi:MAG: DUF2914 domain-containing protein, partial [Calditrichia bacterium]
HFWQHYDSRKQKWETTDRLGYAVTGGRKEGYRGFTFKRNVTPGKWRVEVKTENHQILGRIGFSVIEAGSPVSQFKIIRK